MKDDERRGDAGVIRQTLTQVHQRVAVLGEHDGGFMGAPKQTGERDPLRLAPRRRARDGGQRGEHRRSR